MTEPQTAVAEAHVASIYAETLGHDILATILQELRNQTDHWLRLNEEQQQKAIARIRERVRTIVHETTQILMRGEFNAVPCEIDGIKITKEVQISLTMQPNAAMRHALYDAKGRNVLLVLVDAERWLGRMDEIKAKADQLTLFDQDYDPSIDQPGYRRDESPSKPAGTTWADLRKSLGGDAPAEPDAQPEPKEPEAGEAASQNADERTAVHMLLERLWAVGIKLSLGTLQTFTPQQITVTVEWLNSYEEDGDMAKIARPHFLPLPEQPKDEGEDDQPDEQTPEG